MENNEIFEDIFNQIGGIYQKKDKKIFKDIFNQIAGETNNDLNNNHINEINILLTITFNAFFYLDPFHYDKNITTYGDNNDKKQFKFNELFPKILDTKFDLNLLENVNFDNNQENTIKNLIRAAICKYENQIFEKFDNDLEITNNVYDRIFTNKSDFDDLINKMKFIKISFDLLKKFCNLDNTKIDYKQIIILFLKKYYIDKFNGNQHSENNMYEMSINIEKFSINSDQTIEEINKIIDKLKNNIDIDNKYNNEHYQDNENDIYKAYKVLSYNNNVEAVLTIFLLLHCICFDKIIFIVIKYYNYNILEESKDELENAKEFLFDLQKFVELNFNDEEVLEESVMQIIEKEIKRDEHFLEILEDKLKK